MAGSLADVGEALALNLLFRNTDASPTNVYLGLATSGILDSNSLAEIIEEDDGGYSRQVVTFTVPADNGAGAMEITNDGQIQFGPWASNADSAITHAFLTDVSSGTTGNLLAWFELPESKTPSSGETLTVPVNELIFSIA